MLLLRATAAASSGQKSEQDHFKFADRFVGSEDEKKGAPRSRLDTDRNCLDRYKQGGCETGDKQDGEIKWAKLTS